MLTDSIIAFRARIEAADERAREKLIKAIEVREQKLEEAKRKLQEAGNN